MFWVRILRARGCGFWSESVAGWLQVRPFTDVPGLLMRQRQVLRDAGDAPGPLASHCRTPAPTAIVCKGCNREFFARSLPIHQKICFQKHAFVDIVCAKCRTVIRSGRFHEHEQCCTGEKSQDPLGDQTQVSPHPSGEAKAGDGINEELNEPDEDGRVRCRKCGRGFTQDRIAKHQAVCRDSPHIAASKNKYNPAKEAKRGASSPTILRRRRSQTDTVKPHYITQSKVLNVSFQQQQASQSRAAQATATCVSRSYDFGSHFSSPSENIRERDKKRFDIVLRDTPQRQQQGFGSQSSSRFASNSSASSLGLSAKSLGLLASNVTSSANPLATNRFMTTGSFR